jgi:hypothetical protein
MEQLFWVSTGIPRTRSLIARPRHETISGVLFVRAEGRWDDGCEWTMGKTTIVPCSPGRFRN